MASLYLHIPFCEKKCIYCDFYSIETLSPIDDFLQSLLREITLQNEFHNQSIETIFFGGGTPSLLSSQQFEMILHHLDNYFHIAPHAEITVECNPGTVNKEKLNAYHSLGINRLSFGAQSFFDDYLQFLSRIHNAQEAKQAILLAHRAGFDNINLDLIFSLPQQTIQKWEQNLLQAVLLEPTHISAYSLMVEPNTPLHRLVAAKQVTVLPSEEDAEMYMFTMDFLEIHGYEQYEVSNYGKKNYHCQHNKNYWNHSNYISFGPSAHSFWNNDEMKRWLNIANISTYNQQLTENKLPLAGSETLTRQQLFEEAIMLGLRSEGIDLFFIEQHFGKNVVHDITTVLQQNFPPELFIIGNTKIRLTKKGYLFCEEIAEQLISRLDD